MTPLKSIWLSLCVAVGLAVSIVGCGGGDEEGSGGGETAAGTETGGGANGGSAKTGGSVSGGDQRPNIDGIPLDVFYNDPLVVAAETGQVVAAATPTTGTGTDPGTTEPETTEGGESTTAEPASASGGAVVWSDVITAAMVKDEMMSIRLQLQQRLATLASYNSSYLEIPVFGSTLGLLAEVARRHPDDISFKKNAKYIRVLSAEMVEVCSSAAARGRKSYDTVNGAFLKISEILNNNSPAELPEAEDESDLLEAADMGYLMQRMKRGMQWMQNNTGSEESFGENADVARREVSVIATIGLAITDESYGYGDDGEFTGYAGDLRKFALEMNKASEGKNFSSFDELRSKVDQKCTQCHMKYFTN